MADSDARKPYNNIFLLTEKEDLLELSISENGGTDSHEHDEPIPFERFAVLAKTHVLAGTTGIVDV